MDERRPQQAPWVHVVCGTPQLFEEETCFGKEQVPRLLQYFEVSFTGSRAPHDEYSYQYQARLNNEGSCSMVFLRYLSSFKVYRQIS